MRTFYITIIILRMAAQDFSKTGFSLSACVAEKFGPDNSRQAGAPHKSSYLPGDGTAIHV
jgi:hypothetical protein